ncbi:DUF349 domain-containing protein [Thalassotalea euphylliae]|uniref:DUF349 domain-containing protein n=1 Tax=Thalassotalea euphylliae TaxID=1655234 RepID=A0A3E0TRP5_9GAMM|nr:DUF349 domain-containing protein [Thalassotalea euphylliae]REL27020.1 DUF349 domain-containing protein [Thalassotalea euphylliae]
MIFKKLFASKANWQHQDPNVRVSCIEQELSLSDTEALQIIHQLAATDESALVRRAALLKLDDFDAWQQALAKDNTASIRRVAEQKIVEAIAGDNEQLTTNQRIEKAVSLNKAMAEQVLNQTSDTQLIIAILEKLEKPHLQVNVAQQKAQAEVWQFIIERTNELEALEKLAKKVNVESAKAVVEEKIAALTTAQELPKKIAKDAQLTLSKLLALKDVADYETVIAKRATLEQEWQTLSAQFELLTDETAQTFVDKYASIIDTLDKVFVAKAEQYQQAQIAAQVAEQQKVQQQAFEQALTTTEQAISEAIFENKALDEQSLAAKLTDFCAQVSDSVLNDQSKQALIAKAENLIDKLAKVSDIAASVANATQLIARFAQQTPPNVQQELADKQAAFRAWLHDWRENARNANGVLPASIISAHKEIKDKWLSALGPLEKAQEQLVRHVQRKASDLKRLLASGKYNAAFGVFNNYKRAYSELTAELQHKVHRDFEQLSEKMAELSDWEHYIATPRKKELLEEIQKLAQSPMDNPTEQANKVKWYRKTWNTLGHADEEIDRELNQAFNLACEQAFAPCRLFYAEQEKIRDAHLATRKVLIEEFEQLASQISNKLEAAIDYKSLEAKFNKLSQQWRSAGDIDRKAHKKISQQYQSLIKPIRAAINGYHHTNEEAKWALIKEAEQLVTQLADEQTVFDAVSKVKQLQQQWKAIGYAGAKKENLLWQKFRAVNDQIFGRRQQLQSQHKQENAEQLASVKASVESLSQGLMELTDSNANASVDSSLATISELESQALALKAELQTESHINKSALNLVTQFLAKCEQARQSAKANSAKQDWQRLFALFTAIATDSVEKANCQQLNDFNALSKTYQRKVMDNLATKQSSQRLALTVTVEIIAGIDSPAADQALRRELQVKLMQQKMNSGELKSTEEKLWLWLQDGQLTAQDLPLIERLQPIFCEQEH